MQDNIKKISPGVVTGFGGAMTFGMLFIGTTIALTDGFSTPIEPLTQTALILGFSVSVVLVAFLASYAASALLKKTLGEHATQQEYSKAEENMASYNAVGLFSSLIPAFAGVGVYKELHTTAEVGSNWSDFGNSLLIMGIALALGTLLSTAYAVYKTKKESESEAPSSSTNFNGLNTTIQNLN